MNEFDILHSSKTSDAQKKKALNALVSKYKDLDYDYQGAFNAGIRPDDRGHWDNKYKTPKHITAGTDSIYNTKETPLGNWKQLERPLETGEEWKFEPSEYQVKNIGEDKYKDYFRQYEAGKGGAVLKLPSRSMFDKIRNVFK